MIYSPHFTLLSSSSTRYYRSFSFYTLLIPQYLFFSSLDPSFSLPCPPPLNLWHRRTPYSRCLPPTLPPSLPLCPSLCHYSSLLLPVSSPLRPLFAPSSLPLPVSLLPSPCAPTRPPRVPDPISLTSYPVPHTPHPLPRAVCAQYPPTHPLPCAQYPPYPVPSAPCSFQRMWVPRPRGAYMES